MTGMQYTDAAADYYVPRHAAWLLTTPPTDADAEPAQYQVPVMYVQAPAAQHR